MGQVQLSKPVLIYFYGFPGSGKSYIAKHLDEHISAALVSEDQIRHDLFDSPRFTNEENQVVFYMMRYLASKLLKAGVSVLYDVNATTAAQRQSLKSLAEKNKALPLLIWVQIDPESAFIRTQTRDKRLTENRYAQQPSRQAFDSMLGHMQNPRDEEYLVISGKHSFITQKSAVINRLYQMGLIESSVVQAGVAKPGLVNLIPLRNSGRVDMSRRNINIG